MSGRWTAAEPLWEMLVRRQREGSLPPVFLYGTGDGADKCLTVLSRLGIPAAGVFASDAFVRGQSFRGFPVLRYAQVREQYPAAIGLLCFAVDYEPMLSRITRMAAEMELYAPDLPVAEGDGLFDFEYVEYHNADFDDLYDRLADDASRRVLEGLVAGKLTGRIPLLRGTESPREEAWRELLAPGPSERFLDLGAYNGDTVRFFLEQTGGQYASIDAVEPDPKSFEKLSAFTETLPQASAWPLAVGAEAGTAYIRRGNRGRGSGLAVDGVRSVAVDSVDHLLAGRPVSLVKMDVEGMEADTLRGMRETIVRWRPRMAVSTYHRREDLFVLPALVWDMEPAYRVYLRRHPYLPGWESVLYFV